MKKNNPFLRKTFVLVAIGALLAMMVAPLAHATETLYMTNGVLNLNMWGHIWSGSATAVNKSWGVTFNGNDQYLSRVRFYIHNVTATMTGELICYLLNDTFAGEPIAESTTYNMANLAGDTWVTFTFDDTFNLSSAQTYLAAMTIHQTLSNEFHYGESNTGGQKYGTIGTGFNTHTYGMIYEIYTDDVSGGGTPYVPPSTVDTTEYSSLIEGFIAFIVPLIILLLPVFLLMMATGSRDKWIILIGLAIGAGLGFYFGIVPMWLVFLVAIGLIGMAYQSVRGGG